MTMTRKQAKVYKEYLDWLEKENEPGLRAHQDLLKKEKKRHKEKLRRWEQKTDRHTEKVEAWAERGFLYRCLVPAPSLFPLENVRPVPYGLPYLLPFVEKAASQEGFREWLVKVKYKL